MVFESSLFSIDNRGELTKRIEQCGERNQTFVRSFKDKPFLPFFLPVDGDTIKQKFSHSAIQLSSGQSIVVADENYVYKLLVNVNVGYETEAKLLKWYEELNKISCICLPHNYDC